MHGNAKNIQGQTFGYLKVLKLSNQKSNQGVLWESQCLLCDRIITVPTKQLTSGHRISCGNHPEIANKQSMEKQNVSRKDGVLMSRFQNTLAKNNKTGVRGVSAYPLRSSGIRYEAMLEVNGHRYRKRGFNTVDEAANYRKQLESMYLPKNKAPY